LLAASDVVSLVTAVVAQQERFVDVQVISPAAVPGRFETGRSRVLTDVGDLATRFGERIQQILPQVLRDLKMPAFRIGRVEAQLTATSESQSLRFHASPPGAELTFVFMFHQEPKRFSGGDLRIFNARLRRGLWVPASSFKTISARQNTLVVFPSRFTHEILAVHSRSRAFANCLFTLTGWLLK